MLAGIAWWTFACGTDSCEACCAGRVLIYLEAEALGQAVPDFAVHLLGDLLRAAEALGLRSLQVRVVQRIS